MVVEYLSHKFCLFLCILSILPPHRTVCHLHFGRSNYVAKSWKSTFISVIDFPNTKDHGWTEDGSIVWIKDIFPREIVEILYKEDLPDSEYTLESEGESEDEH